MCYFWVSQAFYGQQNDMCLVDFVASLLCLSAGQFLFHFEVSESRCALYLKARHAVLTCTSLRTQNFTAAWYYIHMSPNVYLIYCLIFLRDMTTL